LKPPRLNQSTASQNNTRRSCSVPPPAAWRLKGYYCRRIRSVRIVGIVCLAGCFLKTRIHGCCPVFIDNALRESSKDSSFSYQRGTAQPSMCPILEVVRGLIVSIGECTYSRIQGAYAEVRIRCSDAYDQEMLLWGLVVRSRDAV